MNTLRAYTPVNGPKAESVVDTRSCTIKFHEDKTATKQDKEGLSFVLTETFFLSHLNHPSIMKPIRWDVDKHQILLPTMERGDLLELLRNHGPLTETVTKFIIRALLDAVAYLARCHICHLDIKPDNILISDDGRPVLCDFGLAEFMGTGNTVHGGTKGYQAPEILQQSPNIQKADIWSVGVVLFMCLRAQHLFGDKKPKHPPIVQPVYDCALEGRLWEVKRDYPEAHSLLVKMLAFDPKKRITAREALRHKWLKIH